MAMNNSSVHSAGMKPANPLPFSFLDLRAKILNIFIWGTAIACILEIYLFWGRTLPLFTEILIAAFLVLLVAALVPMPQPIRVWILLSILFGLALHEVALSGIFSSARLFLLAFILVTGILFDRRGFWIALGMSTVLLVLTGWLVSVGMLRLRDSQVTAGSLASWIVGSLLMVLAAYLLEEGWKRLQSEFFVTQATLKNAMSTLSNERVNLETRISERTREVVTNAEFQKKRADRYHLIDEIVRTVDPIQDPEELMGALVQQITENFSLYHVGIYLNDENNASIILRAAHGAGSDRLLSKGIRLKIDQSSFIGYVAASGLPRISRRAKDDILFMGNPDLPETRSVMSLPLLKDQRAIGVLDLESSLEGGLSEQDLETMSALANQASIAIENTRTLSETRQALSEARVVYGHYMRQAWEQLAAERRTVGYQYSASKVNPLDTPLELPEIQTVLESGQPVTSSEERSAITIPLKLRDEIIGVLDIRYNNSKRQFNENEMALIQAIAERVSLALENARLFEETTRRADRERTVSEITTHIRSTTDPQAMLKTALEELKRALGAKDIRIHPYSPPVNE